MLYWYPRIKDLPIPQPETIIVEVDPRLAYDVADGKAYPYPPTLREAAQQLGYPVFIRSDYLSGKHAWEDTCHVPNGRELDRHVCQVVEETLTCDVMGRPVNAIVFREFIPMASEFTAFYGNMPVNPERRYFVKDGQVLCHHAYWIEEAIEESKAPSAANWRELSRLMNWESSDEIELLTQYALTVAKSVDGYWSVDFCQAKDGRWMLIDMALGQDSWHPEGCSAKPAA